MNTNAPQAWFSNLGIEINSLPRVAFSIFGFEIYWYAVIIFFGIIAALAYVVWAAKKTGQKHELYLDYFVWAFLSSMVFGRLYYVIFSTDASVRGSFRDLVNLRGGGLAIYGVIIGSVISAVIYTKIKKINFWLFADTAAPALILGQAIGRWGNFFNREAYGRFTNNIFALRYLRSEAFGGVSADILENIVHERGTQYIQVHPTFLYESIGNFVIFIALNILRKYKKFDGEIFMYYFLFYGILRFFVEGIRIDQLTIGNTSIAISQVLSAVLALMAVGVIIFKRKIKKPIANA
ncbi:MAG: prolipoprotein diacylglyceryl transferase [Defluviitaleaceae bacterium]|nr:prolipoprotein diacylglyceryl transferase [Defluviitaleaceae bacterium]